MKKDCFFIATFFAASAASILTSASASSEQCIYNQAGYIARVKWYRPSDIEISKDSNGNIAAGLKNTSAKAVLEKQIALSKESCTGRSEKLLAVVSIVGGKYAKTSAEVGIGALIGAGVAVACVGSGGTGCLAGAAAAGVIVDGFARTALPDAKEVFYVDIPPDFQNRRGKPDLRLIIHGTVFNPKVRFGKI